MKNYFEMKSAEHKFQMKYENFMYKTPRKTACEWQKVQIY